MNTMMELRKCCNHPYLIKGNIVIVHAANHILCILSGAEDKIHSEHVEQNPGDYNGLQLMIQSAGKLVLIDKLLPKLKANGHKV